MAGGICSVNEWFLVPENQAFYQHLIKSGYTKEQLSPKFLKDFYMFRELDKRGKFPSQEYANCYDFILNYYLAWKEGEGKNYLSFDDIKAAAGGALDYAAAIIKIIPVAALIGFFIWAGKK